MFTIIPLNQCMLWCVQRLVRWLTLYTTSQGSLDPFLILGLKVFNEWPWCDWNTQPSDLESDALPLRHKVIHRLTDVGSVLFLQETSKYVDVLTKCLPLHHGTPVPMFIVVCLKTSKMLNIAFNPLCMFGSMINHNGFEDIYSGTFMILMWFEQTTF